MKNKKLILVFSVVIVLIILSCLAFQSINSRYTKEGWLNHADIRYKMIDDIEKNNPLIGKTQQEVQELLGEPDSIWKFDSNEDCAYIYYIGKEKSLFSLMDETDMYMISFQDGLVIGTSVQPT